MNRFFRVAACCSAVLAAGSASAQQQPPSPPAPPNPMGNDPSGRIPHERNANDHLGRTDWTREAADAAATERLKKKKGDQATDAEGRPALRATAASLRDVVAGAAVTDRFGAALGKIEGVVASEAVIVTPTGLVKIPVEAFGKSRKGLLVDMPRTQFEALVAQANAPRPAP